jgi:hypothetical protein
VSANLPVCLSVHLSSISQLVCHPSILPFQSTIHQSEKFKLNFNSHPSHPF